MRPKCLEDKCEKQASQNYPGEKKGMYCSKHRLSGMIDITAKRCIESNCFKIPSFNYVGEKKGLYCKEHHKPDMISVKKNVLKKDVLQDHILIIQMKVLVNIVQSIEWKEWLM